MTLSGESINQTSSTADALAHERGDTLGSSEGGRRTWTSTTASRHLRGRRKVDTEPELLLRRAIHAAGGRYRLHPRLAKGCTPDFTMPRYRLAVFVDGDYWHGCPEHGRRTPFTGPNADLWEDKLRRNRARDERATRVAEELGWRVLRVWECEVRADPQEAARRVVEIARKSGS